VNASKGSSAAALLMAFTYSRVVAAGLTAAGPDAGAADRRAAVEAALAGEGLDPAAPHLDPGSADLALSMW